MMIVRNYAELLKVICQYENILKWKYFFHTNKVNLLTVLLFSSFFFPNPHYSEKMKHIRTYISGVDQSLGPSKTKMEIFSVHMINVSELNDIRKMFLWDFTFFLGFCLRVPVFQWHVSVDSIFVCLNIKKYLCI